MAFDENDQEDLEQEDEETTEESEELDEEEQTQKKSKNKAQERVLKNKIKTIKERLNGRQLPLYTPSEKITIQKAEKNKALKTDVYALKLKMATKRVQFASKSISSISPAIPYILIGALIILALIAFVALLSSLFPWLFPSDNPGGSLSQGATSQFGVSGKDFYGVRTIYRDDKKLRGAMVEQYVELLQDGINQATQITTISTGGETYNTDVVVYIALPSNDYDYSAFEETAFASNYVEVYNFVKDVAGLIYTADTNLTAPETLTEMLDAIKYFGINENAKTDIETKVRELVLPNYQLTATKDGTTVEESATISNINEEFSTQYANSLNTYFGSISTARAEKVFIKDFLFEKDDDRMSGILKEQYVEAIFMPKRDLNFTSMSLYVTYADFDNFQTNFNGTEFSKDENNLKFNDDDPDIFLFQTGEISVAASTFENIDLEHKNELKNGIALVELMNLNAEGKIDSSKYLEEKTDEQNIVYYTWKSEGAKINFVSDIEFIFVEFETKVS